MITRNVIKDPEAEVDFTLDWSDYLEGSDVIDTVTWTVPSGITKGATANTDTTTTIWLSSGENWEDYIVVCEILTTDGRTDQRSLRVMVRQQ